MIVDYMKWLYEKFKSPETNLTKEDSRNQDSVTESWLRMVGRVQQDRPADAAMIPDKDGRKSGRPKMTWGQHLRTTTLYQDPVL